MSDSWDGMNVRESAITYSPLIKCGPGPSTSSSLPSSPVVYQRSSPGLAGLGCFGSSHAAQRRTTHNPSGRVGGFPAPTTRQRCLGFADRFQPLINTYCDSVKSEISSKQISECGLPLYLCLSVSSWHPPMSIMLPLWGRRHVPFWELYPSRVPRISAIRSASPSASLFVRRRISERSCSLSANPISKSDFPPPACPPKNISSAGEKYASVCGPGFGTHFMCAVASSAIF